MPERHTQKLAKMAAKKVAAKKTPHSPERNGRRACEHLGRVRVLLSHSRHNHEAVDQLLSLANRTLQARKYKHAADLLRAGEHLAFAELLKDDKETVSPELHKEIEHEVLHLQERAANHAAPEDMDEPLRHLFGLATRNAQKCFESGALRSTLEYTRAAEALTHVDELGALALPEHESKRLAS